MLLLNLQNQLNLQNLIKIPIDFQFISYLKGLDILTLAKNPQKSGKIPREVA